MAILPKLRKTLPQRLGGPRWPRWSVGVLAGLLSCVAGLLPLPSSAGAAGHQDLSALLRQHGLQPLDATPAIDFTLPDLQGAEHRLADHEGRWVLLTFFATWCGPCAMEMPSLQRLQDAFRPPSPVAGSTQGAAATPAVLEVLGISIDAPGTDLTSYVERQDIRFAVLHDASSRVARTYQASAIPVSFLIDPSGMLRAVARGARNWDRSHGLWRQLLGSEAGGAAQHASGGSGGTSHYATGDKVALPAVLHPPTAKVGQPETDLLVGRPFVVDVDVTWAGAMTEYVLQPPKLVLPEELTQLGPPQARTSSETGGRRVRYRFRLQTDVAGSYAIDPVEVRYIPHGAQEPMAARIQGPTVQIRRPWWQGGPGAGTVLLLGGALFLGVAGTVVMLTARRQRQRHQHATQQSKLAASSMPAQQAQVALEQARRHRQEGAFAAMLDVWLSLSAVAGWDTALAPLVATWKAWRDRCRYGGEVPPQTEVEAWQRTVERHLATMQPNSGRSANKPADKRTQRA